MLNLIIYKIKSKIRLFWFEIVIVGEGVERNICWCIFFYVVVCKSCIVGYLKKEKNCLKCDIFIY